MQLYDVTESGELEQKDFIRCLNSAGWELEDAKIIFDEVWRYGGMEVC